MGLRLYNTLTRTKDEFRPIDPANVRMYVCGPTVYDFAHIGNARPLIVFDVLFRLLRHIYGPEQVTYVRNITDVDDKINARAAEEYPDLPLNEAIRAVTARTEKQFHEDVADLGCLPPTVEPRATEHIEEMKAIVERLIATGCAYVADDHVLFDVAAMKDYGRLSNRSLDEMIAGARVEVAPYKRNATDFVLWKPSKQEGRSEATGKTTGGEPAWPSPAGIATPGRPGWHLECSAMSDRWLWQEAETGLGEAGRARPHQFDIHGGGIDLVFPHHENEIAQSRCAFATPAMANYWLHNGFLQVEGEKMAKSVGNFVTIRELLTTRHFGGRMWSGEVLKVAMLMTHYREPIDFTATKLEEAERRLKKWRTKSQMMPERDFEVPDPALLEALSDDLNTPKAFARLDVMSGGKPTERNLIDMSSALRFLGLQQSDEEGGTFVRRAGKRADYIRQSYSGPFSSRGEIDAVFAIFDHVDVNEAITTRAEARKAKNYAEADRIRAELDAMGIALKDTKDPETGELMTTWEVKR